MKHFQQVVVTASRGLLASVGLLLLSGCSSDDAVVTPEDVDFAPTLADYADHVVVATYADMRDRCAELRDACAALAATPSQGAMDDAASRWIAAREPWEASEAFLFGPAAFMNLDPALDSWPVDHQQLDDVLVSSLPLTPEFVADGLGPALRGYHTVEYLLFRDGTPRDVDLMSARERDYLAAAASVLADDAATLWASWATGVDGGVAFRDEFASAGTGGSGYTSQTAAIEELLDGMIAICDEVANGKIADPYDENDTSLVESRFSHNSLTDFQNNMRSVRNAYMGEYSDAAQDGVGLNEFVEQQDAALHARLLQEIDAAISAIAAIPEPFVANLAATSQIEAAQTAISTVLETLVNDVKPLVIA